MGAALSCIIWMGLSLYFAIISFQAKSPFYSYINTTAIYIFGTINLVFFGIALGTLLPIYFKSYHGIKRATLFIFVALAFLLLDMLINTILFIVDRDNYVNWCIRSASLNLKVILQQVDGSSDPQAPSATGFSTEMGDFYNCSRTWEDELKFSIMMTIVMIMVYSYWAISLHSYSHKLRIDLRVMMTQNMNNTRLPMMMPAQGGPIVTGADIMLQ
ncbi:hypothetical protein MUCCIDRAFT_155090 [Mucor lusitanicus CBS 277.49]|uniref:Uncharacterized protein n=2 Tax=Mucor circinelloides f. lusitanicus TaxID=29924 RepID=A0A168QDH4_MUCCL|nr:hypothetical protein MUCCIDRAFT_155090 [Mucor lusitanicus CBS 277.49]